MRPGGFEPPTNSSEGCCSIHLSYGRHTVGLSDSRTGVGAAGFEPATSWSQTRRATGLRHTPNDETHSRLDAQTRRKTKLLDPPQQHLAQRPEGPASEGDPALGRRRRLPEAHPAVGGDEQP